MQCIVTGLTVILNYVELYFLMGDQGCLMSPSSPVVHLILFFFLSCNFSCKAILSSFFLQKMFHYFLFLLLFIAIFFLPADCPQLDYQVSRHKLKEVFALAGNVVNAEIKEDKNGKSRGMGIVEFEQPLEAVQAVCILGNRIALYRGNGDQCSLD